MSDKENDLLKWIGSIDQFTSALKIITPLFWSYYRNLVEQGFTPDQAFTMTREFQTVYWTRAFGKGKA